MAERLIIMSKIKQIIRLKLQGRSLQGISKALGCSRNTVKKYPRLIESKGLETSLLLNKSDEELEYIFTAPADKTLDRYQQLKEMFHYIGEELARTGFTRWMLWVNIKISTLMVITTLIFVSISKVGEKPTPLQCTWNIRQGLKFISTLSAKIPGDRL